LVKAEGNGFVGILGDKLEMPGIWLFMACWIQIEDDYWSQTMTRIVKSYIQFDNLTSVVQPDYLK